MANVKDGLRGVAAGILTPFEEDTLDVAHEKLQENARTVYEQGMRTFLACANISEYHSLTHEERIAVTRDAAEALPEDACILAGAGGGTRTAIRLAEAYAEMANVDAIMVMPPDHTYKHERGLLTYYRKIGEATRLPLVPYVRGFDPSVEFLADLTDLDSVAGVKWALEDVPKFAEAIEAGADDVVWSNGMAEPMAPALWMEGAEGFTAGVSNFEPVVGLELYDALENGEWDRAREIRNATIPFMNFRETAGENNAFPAANSVPAVKRGLELSGKHGGPVRDPIVGLSPADRDRVDRLYADLEEFIAEL